MRHYYLIFYFLILSLSLQSQGTIDSLVRALDSATQEDEKIEFNLALSREYQRVDLLKSKYHAQVVLDDFAVNDSLKIVAFDLLGRFYFYSSKLDSALFFFRKENEYFKENDLQLKSASIGISIGSVLLRQGAHEAAVKEFLSSLSYFESQNLEIESAKCYTNLATAFAELEEFGSAIDYSHKALVIARKNQMLAVQSIILPNLATQYEKSGDRTNAIIYYKEAEEFATKHDNKRSLALVYNNLGNLYLTSDSLDLAQAYIEKAINIKIELNQLKGLEEAYFNLGQIYFKKGNRTEALKYYNRIEDKVDGFREVAVLKGLKELYADNGQYQKALSYADKALLLADTISQEESKKSIAELTTKYESAKKENEILQLKSDNQELEIGKIQNRTLAILLGAAFITALAFLFLFYKNSNRKRQIAEQQHRIEQQEILAKLSQQEQDAVERMINSQEQERKRIAGDLHDSLGSKLATLKRYIEVINTRGIEDRKTVSDALALADESYSDVREIAHNINSGVLVEEGLIPAIQQMATNVSKINEVNIDVIATDLKKRLSNHVGIQIFRIIQELINNVIKHAHAKEVNIQLIDHEDELTIIVEDDGVGINSDIQNTGGMGLRSIENRVQLIKGQYKLDSSPESGTSVIINVPI